LSDDTGADGNFQCILNHVYSKGEVDNGRNFLPADDLNTRMLRQVISSMFELSAQRVMAVLMTESSNIDDITCLNILVLRSSAGKKIGLDVSLGSKPKGDGSTDDTVILNSVLSYAANLSSVVYFPFGVYKVDNGRKVGGVGEDGVEYDGVISTAITLCAESSNNTRMLRQVISSMFELSAQRVMAVLMTPSYSTPSEERLAA
jgi:hypothetical protein